METLKEIFEEAEEKFKPLMKISELEKRVSELEIKQDKIEEANKKLSSRSR